MALFAPGWILESQLPTVLMEKSSSSLITGEEQKVLPCQEQLLLMKLMKKLFEPIQQLLMQQKQRAITHQLLHQDVCSSLPLVLGYSSATGKYLFHAGKKWPHPKTTTSNSGWFFDLSLQDVQVDISLFNKCYSWPLSEDAREESNQVCVNVDYDHGTNSTYSSSTIE